MQTPALRHKGRKTWLALALLLLSALAHATAPRTVLVMGDSLSAAYGLRVDQGWVALMGQRLAQAHPDWRVVNASVSGETTGGGRNRLPRALEEHAPAVVILELGANDALRGLPPEQAHANLDAMIQAAADAGARVLLVGTEVPPNYGPDYAAAFRTLYAQLAAARGTPFLPFLLEPIATDLGQFQADGLHPTAQAQPRVLDHLWPALEPLLD